MSPAIYSGQKDDRRSTDNDSQSDNNTHTTAILIASIVIAVVVILGVIAFLCYNRRGGERQYREACQKDPYLTRKEFARRKRLSALERIEEDEMQRSVMIRKSLTSRSSNYPVDNSDNDSALNQAMVQVPHSNLSGNSDWAPSSRRGRAVSNQEPHRGGEVDLHSPLFVQLSTDRVWHQDITSEKNPRVYRTVLNKRQELRRRKKEAKRRRKIFDQKNSIYTPKPYTSKMLNPAGAPALDEHGNAIGDFKQDLNIIVECPDCREQPPNLVEEFSSGDMVCGSCGLVVGERIIDTRSEWRTFANDDQGNDDPSRVGDAGNPLLDGAQLETSIAFSEGRDHKNLARIQNKSQTDKNTKAIGSAFREISAFTDSINLGKNVADGAKHIYKLCHDHSFMKGKPQEALVAGCIFIACRQAGVGRTFREIYQVTNVSKKEIGRVFKALESFLQKIKETNPGGNAIQDLSGYKASTSTNAGDLCTRFTSQLPFRQSQKIENVSRALARKTVSVSELAGRSPLSVSAACIYMASHLMEEPKTSKDIAAVAGVSDGTIKTAYKFLYQARERLIEKEWGVSQKAIDSLPVN
ncbi:hypothetical protein ACHAO5_002310 [Verticillium nonalfalfae]